jgi:hypothetical protein
LLRERQASRIFMLDRDTRQRSIVLHQIHDAPVCDIGHGEAGDGAQRCVVIEGFGQHPTRLGQEALALSRCLRTLLALTCPAGELTLFREAEFS